MTPHGSILTAGGGVIDRFDRLARLDYACNPYGPCPAAVEAAARFVESPIHDLAPSLRRRLSETYRVPFEAIHLLSSADSALGNVLNCHTRPIVGFPPSATAMTISENSSLLETVWMARGPARDGFIGPESAADLPRDGIAVLDSPSDPLGSILSPADAVRLSRACRYVVIDERFAEYSEFTTLPLTNELDNVVVLRSFEAWAGLQHSSCAWAVASPRLAADLHLEVNVLEPEAIAAAIATLDNRASVGATLKLIREERSRLYRLLRKLAFLEPLPSWAPFLAARAQIVPREAVVDGLLIRGVRIHAPREPGLEQFVRIGIGTRTAMERLRHALLDLAPELVA